MADIVTGENKFAQDLARSYANAKRIKMPMESDWRKIAEWGLPRQFGGWVSTGMAAVNTGAARQSRINTYDSTLTRALPVYAAVLERLMTPSMHIYHTLTCEDPRKMQSRAIKLGLDRLNDAIFARRYQPRARFAAAQAETYMSGGAYGNAGKMITWRKPNKQLGTKGGFLYRNIPFCNLFWDVDDEEQIRTKYRRISWTAQQAVDALGEKCPKKVAEAAKNTSGDQSKTYEFFQCIRPSNDYDEHALDYRRHPIGSYYVYAEEPCIVQEAAGYSSDPLLISRSATEGGQPYGYGPAQVVLSTIGMLNAQKKTWLRQGQLALQPPLLTRDDGVMNGTVDLTPGAANPGGVNSQGQKMVYALEPGNFTIVEKMILQEQDDVKEVLFGRIFEITKDQAQKTTAEILDIAAKEAATLAPTMGRWQADDLGPTIEREVLLMAENGAWPEDMPSELNGTDYKPVFTSPLAKSQRMESVRGFLQMSDWAMNIAKMTNDNRPVRRLNYDVAQPEIADYLAVPARWVKSDEEMAADDAKVAERQQTQDAIDVAPAAVSALKTVTQPDKQMRP